MELQLMKRRGNPDLARIQIKERTSQATLSPNLETMDNQQHFTYRSQTLFTGSSDTPMQSQGKNSSRFPMHILDQHDYDESLRGIFSKNGQTRLRYQKIKNEIVVVHNQKKECCSRFSKKWKKNMATLLEYFPWLSVIPCLEVAPVEQEDDSEDVDCDALEQKFLQDLRRESKSIKNWKMLLTRVQIVRAFGFSQKDNNQAANANQDEPQRTSVNEKPWWQNGSLILDPESTSLLVWNFFKSLIIAASFFTFIFQAAFYFADREQTIGLELFFDVIQVFDIFLVFFTAVKSSAVLKTARQLTNCKPIEGQSPDQLRQFVIGIEATTYWEKDMKIIAVNYFLSYFIFDFFACVPGLLTSEQKLKVYPFKVLRVIRMPRLMQFLQYIFNRLKQHNMKHQNLILNLYKILQTSLMLAFSLHCLTCAFIAIGLYPNQDSWVLRLGLITEQSKTQVLVKDKSSGMQLKQRLYITSLYFITTTITTIGYGDIWGVSIFEKTYIILLLFLGILVFTTIQQRTRSIEFDPTRKKVIMEAEQRAIEFMFQIDQKSVKSMSDNLYTTVQEFFVNQADKSTNFAFSNNAFYNDLTPGLQTQLVTITLGNQLRSVNFFTNDFDLGFTADWDFVKRLVSNLVLQQLNFGDTVIADGQVKTNFYIIKENSVAVVSENQGIRLVDLNEGSFFGEYEILFNSCSEYSYIATNKQHKNMLTQLYYCEEVSFTELMSKFPRVERFVRQRAVKRKNYLHYLEQKLSQKIDEINQKQPQSFSSLQPSPKSVKREPKSNTEEGTPRFRIPYEFNYQNKSPTYEDDKEETNWANVNNFDEKNLKKFQQELFRNFDPMDIKDQTILNQEKYFEIYSQNVRNRLAMREQKAQKFSRNDQILHQLSNNNVCKLDFKLQEISKSLNLTCGMWTTWYQHCKHFFEVVTTNFDFEGQLKRTDVEMRNLLRAHEVNHINLKRKLKSFYVCHFDQLVDDSTVYSNTIFMIQNRQGSLSQSVIKNFTEGKTGFEYHKQVSFDVKQQARTFRKPSELVISEEEEDSPKRQESSDSLSLSDN